MSPGLELPAAWRPHLAAELEQPYVSELLAFVAGERRQHAVFPPEEEVLAVVVGPEGGISPEETAALEAVGATTVRLGPHVMRTASAGPVALAVLAHASGLWE